MHLYFLLVLLQDGVIPSADPIAFERIRALAPKQTYRTGEFEWMR